MSKFTDTWNDLRWLTSADAGPNFALTAEAGLSQLQQADRLRRALSPERARLVLEQTALRRRACEKFAKSERMFFAPAALEQATDELIARYKAQRFPVAKLVLDLCCGIGGDLLALADRGPVLGVEFDPCRAQLAAANLRVCRAARPGASRTALQAARHGQLVVCGDASRLRIPRDCCWHIDPDRRASGRRVVVAQYFSPAIDVLQSMLADAPHAAVKLAPATFVPDTWPQRSELEWISRGGECRQQVAWFGRLASVPTLRRATRVGPSGEVGSIVGRPDVPVDVAQSLGRYLHEPDPAVLAARLTGAFAAELQLWAIDAGSIYLTSDRSACHALAASFEIEAVMPLDVRKLRQHLRARNIGNVEIKKRGVEHDPALVRKQLALRGKHTATVVLTRVAGSGVAIVAQRQVTAPA
ncbi:MAG: hypothetical protein K2Y37_24760 [Pirellulales bacterium]|nr:hypothetical protein [Pirellulales bacterium]